MCIVVVINRFGKELQIFTIMGHSPPETNISGVFEKPSCSRPVAICLQPISHLAVLSYSWRSKLCELFVWLTGTVLILLAFKFDQVSVAHLWQSPTSHQQHYCKQVGWHIFTQGRCKWPNVAAEMNEKVAQNNKFWNRSILHWRMYAWWMSEPGHCHSPIFLQYIARNQLQTKQHVVELCSIKMNTIKWTCRLRKKQSAEFKELLGVEPLSLVIIKLIEHT